MKRTDFKTDLILTADWHLRETTPVCRTDDFWEAQWNKVEQIISMNKDILHAGDLFDHWKASPRLISKFINYFAPYCNFDRRFYTVYGNHDLPQHNKELAYKTATWALKCADALCVLNGVHWGDKPGIEYAFEYKGRNILVYHVMTWKGKEPWPGCTDLSAKRLLKKYSEFDLIVTGHNHKSFTEEYQGRILVNPGSLTRQTADQHKTTPCVYLYNAKNHKIKRHILKHNKQAISRVHLQQVAKTQQRYTAFLQSVKNKEGDLLRFEDMLESFFQTHNVKEPIRRHIYKHMGEESWM